MIEPSIKSPSGHFLQYAQSVLEAAKQAGFATVLACHRDFPPGDFGDTEVVPAFQNEFWHRFASMRDHQSTVSRLYCQASRVKNGLLLRWKASWYFSKPYVVLGHVAGPLWDNLIVRILLLPITIPIYIVWRIFNMVRVRRLFERIDRKFKDLPENMLPASNAAAIREFADDISALAAKLNLTESDELLVATASGAELEGVLQACARSAPAASARWHLVFRRNLREGPEGEFGEDVETWLARRSLESWKGAKPRIRLYTDTEELTQEYDLLSAPGAFTTLPIPHVRASSGAPKPAGPLNIVYLGDARGEKGFPLLSRIADGIRESLLETGRARLRVQSNYNIEGGEPLCLVAKNELSRFPASQVEFLDKPQSEADYWQNLDAAHLSLCAYEVNPYSERSSGIFAECIGAGVPVVVPAGTWMSRQVQEEANRFLAKLYDAAPKLSSDMVHLAPLGLSPEPYNPADNRWFRATGGKPQMLLSLALPSATRQALLKFRISDKRYVRLQATQRDLAGVAIRRENLLLELHGTKEGEEAYALLPVLEGAHRLEVLCENLSPSSLLEYGCALGSSMSRLEHFGAGRIYDDWTEIPQILEEMAGHYGAHEASAREMSKSFTRFHSGETFLQRLGL